MNGSKPNYDGLLNRLADELVSNLPNRYSDNYDYIRFGEPGQNGRGNVLRRMARNLLFSRGFVRDRDVSEMLKKLLVGLAPLAGGLDELYRRLADDQSRELLVKLLAYRCLGHQYVRLPLSGPDYWRGIERVEALAVKADAIDPSFLDWRLHRINMAGIGFPISAYSTPKAVYTQFVLQQYRCDLGGKSTVGVAADDVVIDCGGCWGETALYFAHLAGELGRIYCFEFIPSNLSILQTNFAANPKLARRVDLVQAAVWSESDLRVDYTENGPGSRVAIRQEGADSGGASTLSIDDLVQRRGLDRVDFIKMDIEGAELAALRGAAKTIVTHRPTLAIAAYHDLKDFVELPEFITSIAPHYRLYLRHFTIHQEETILFAVPTP